MSALCILLKVLIIHNAIGGMPDIWLYYAVLKLIDIVLIMTVTGRIASRNKFG